MRIRVAIMLITVVALYTAPMFAADTAAGKDLYTKKCASCHGAAGEGKDSVAKLFKVELKPLTSKEIQSMSDADLKKTILEGTGKMKPVKDVDAKGAWRPGRTHVDARRLRKAAESSKVRARVLR